MKICRLLAIVPFFVVTQVFADATGDAQAHSEAFARAMEARDVKAVLALYADDARVIWPGQGDVAKGKAEIEKLIVATLKAFPDGKIVLKSQEAIPLGNGYLAILGHWEQSFPGQDGKTETVEVRTSEIIKKEGRRTVYVVDHASIGLPPPPEAAPEEKKPR